MGLVTEPHVHPFLRCNIWHLRGADKDVVVDAGLGVASLRSGVSHLFEREPDLLLTHARLDHIGGAHEFATSYAHVAERAHTPAPGTLRRDRLIDALGLEETPYVAAMPDLMVDAAHGFTYPQWRGAIRILIARAGCGVSTSGLPKITGRHSRPRRRIGRYTSK